MVGEMSIAHQNRRVVNTLVDGLLINILSTVAGALVGVAYVAALGRPAGEQDETTITILGMLVGILSGFIYYFVFENGFGRTPAKYLTGTKVVNKDGGRPSFNQILGRTFTRFVPIEAFTFLFSRHPVGWHDSWSGTRVVRINPAGD